MKTKRNLIHIWLLVAAMLPAVAQAQFTFTTNNGAITITGYTGPDGNVTIPSTINGYPVATIGAGAFNNQTTLTSVTTPNSVTNIGSYAFSDCTNLHQAYFQGNAPSVNGGAGGADSTVFYGESGTVYYLPGTTGWGDTFGGWPTLHVTQAVHEAGFIKDERWSRYVISNLIVGNPVLGTPDYQMAVPEWGVSVDNASGHNNFVRRVSGYFKPPTTGFYNFHVTSDDDSMLFLSTDDTPGNKSLIAQQAGWNYGGWAWGTTAGTTNNSGWALMTHSETFTTDGVGGVNAPNSGGIMLVAGQRYYIEQDMHQGGGGANLGVTYTMFGSADPTSGSETALKGSVIEMNVNRCTYVAFTTQPHNIANAPLGSMVGFSAAGTTDSQVSIGGINGYEEDYQNNKLLFQWFTNGVPVPGATQSLFLLGPVTADMVGMPVMCQTRALGFTDDALNPIWTNSTTATITSVVAATPPSLIGHWFSGAATLADSANIVGPGVYDGVPARATTSTRFYYFTNDVPPGAPAGAQALWLVSQGIVITNTSTLDSGYAVDTFDGSIQNGMTVMFWAKGLPGNWNPWVSKYGENGLGWQLRINGYSLANSCWTMRGTGNDDDMTSSIGTGDGKWHHYAGTWNGTNFVRNLYVDGVLAATATGTSLYALAPASALMIGARDAGNHTFGNYFTGGIYDVRIYNYQINFDGCEIPLVILETTTNVQSGQTVQLNAPSLGSSAISYGWMSNNVPVLGAITNSLIVTNVTVSATYTCYATNQCDESYPLEIFTVNVVPVFSGPPVLKDNQVVLTWSSGTLLEATNVAGPWVTNTTATSPYTNIISTTPQMFFKLQ